MNELTEFAQQNNVSIGAIGNGSVLMALDFKEQFNINYPVYTDSSCETYKWIGFRRSIGLGFSTFRHGARASRSGFRQGSTQGHALQQGGEAIILTDGEVIFKNAADIAGDHAPIELIKEQILALAS